MKILGFLSHFWVLGLFLLTCCNNTDKKEERIEFIINSKKVNFYNDLFATVYVSDTNWVEMAKFADSLIKGHGFFSTISFYLDSTNIPIINETYSYYPYDIESVADYTIPNTNRIFEEKKEIEETEDLTFKLFTFNDKVIEVENPYQADYREVNSIIKFNINHTFNTEQTQKTASRFVKLMLESNLDKLSNLFIGEIDKEQLQNIHELLLGTKWDNVRKSEGGSAEKYNLWYVQRSFVKDLDTLKVKIHFDVNKSAEKIERVEYSYLD